MNEPFLFHLGLPCCTIAVYWYLTHWGWGDILPFAYNYNGDLWYHWYAMSTPVYVIWVWYKQQSVHVMIEPLACDVGLSNQNAFFFLSSTGKLVERTFVGCQYFLSDGDHCWSKIILNYCLASFAGFCAVFQISPISTEVPFCSD